MRNLYILTLLLSFTVSSCDSPLFRPKPNFEIVEQVYCNSEGFIDLGCDVKGKIHNYGEAGTQIVKFTLYVGYYDRKTKNGNQASWDEEYTFNKTVFLNKNETKTVSHVFKQIDLLDTGIRCSIKIL